MRLDVVEHRVVEERRLLLRVRVRVRVKVRVRPQCRQGQPSLRS